MDSERLDVKNRIVRINDNLDKKLIAFKSQNYDTLRNECITYKRLFEDSLFLLEAKSIYYTKEIPEDILWKRPMEICENPQFIIREPNISDFDQGILKNSSLVIGCSSLILKTELFEFVIPSGQHFGYPNYCGIFHFRFWYYGKWVDVAIDDRLPVDSNNNLIFGKNKVLTNEFWFPLFEKAYAKFCGSYEHLECINSANFLVDLTSAIVEEFEIKNLQNENRKHEIWNFMKNSLDRESLIRAYISPNPKIKGLRLTNGLAIDRYYAVGKMTTVTNENKKFDLIKIRNQWDEKADWRLPWSEKVNYLIENNEEIEKILLKSDDFCEGEFWLMFDDFYRYFETIQICELTIDAFFLESVRNKDGQKSKFCWNLFSYHGEWIPMKSSGGSGRINEEQYWKNPQLMFTINETDLPGDAKVTTLIISLYQKYLRELNTETNGKSKEKFIQFRIYRVIDENLALEAKNNCFRLYASNLEKCATSGGYINKTEVVKRFKLTPGSYLIIPSCYDIGIKGEFLLRVCSEYPIKERNVSILEEFKSSLEKDDIVFPINRATQCLSNSDKKIDCEGFVTSNVCSHIKELGFYVGDSVFKDNDKVDIKKKNKFFD
ncbi:unnamed protein product [Brachionus calyciflorus]|uniref:Calpain catalytic domain-containing protein n=1 Tax=Brachionus calyciflorus TaxID=104777 RepID=A0A813X1G1_9BILA|nr:unnamed protein product [Brachionus calyciflorus]